MTTLFAALASPILPWALSALIALVALLVWQRFRAGLRPVLQALDRAIATIEETEGPAAFRQRFTSIFKALAENPVLGEAWRAYAGTLRPAPGSEDAIGYVRRPHEHFNDGLLALSGLNLRFYNAFPNLLVGLGLFFTFIGLVGALYFASSGVAAENVRVAQAALRDLLGAATFKFVTSIAGLGSSLLFSWREKAHLHRLYRRLARFCHALEARTVPITTAGLAAAQLEEARQQRQELARLGRGMLVQLPEGAEQRLGEELAAAFAPLRSSVRRLADRLTDDETVLREFRRELGRGGGTAGRARRGGGLEPVGGTPPRDGGHALLTEMRAIRNLLERQAERPMAPGGAGPAAMPARADASAPEATVGVGGRLRLLQFRLQRLAAAVEAVIARLGGGTDVAVRRRELLAIVGDLHEQIREARHSLGALAEHLDRDDDDNGEEVPAALRRTLGELDEGLRRSRQALAGLAESLGGSPGSGA